MKILLHLGPRNSGLGEILRQIIELPNLDFQGCLVVSWESTHGCLPPPVHGCHFYTAPPSKKRPAEKKRDKLMFFVHPLRPTLISWTTNPMGPWGNMGPCGELPWIWMVRSWLCLGGWNTVGFLRIDSKFTGRVELECGCFTHQVYYTIFFLREEDKIKLLSLWIE